MINHRQTAHVNLKYPIRAPLCYYIRKGSEMGGPDGVKMVARRVNYYLQWAEGREIFLIMLYIPISFKHCDNNK